MSVFTGSGVAIVTPMHEDTSVNYEKLAELLEEQIEQGTDSIIICGTTGEASTLSHEEHLDVIRFAVEKVAGRIPVIAGTGSNSTETAVYLSTEAEKYGGDALLLVTPYYNKATQKGLKQHFATVANAVHIPVILYNVPGRTGCALQPETTAWLVENVENIVGIKEASGNFTQIARLMRLCGDKIELYSGNDDQTVPILSLGGRGVISVLANVAPRQTHEMTAAWFAGDTEKSRAMQIEAMDLIDALFCEVNPIPVKTALNLMGKEAGPLRLPLCEMDEKNLERLRGAMTAYGIL